MRLVVALGGNALLKRGEPVSANAQRRNVRLAAVQLAKVAAGNELVIVHGNGPQVGLLALEQATMPQAEHFPLDVLDAESEGMIGYTIEQELGNELPSERACATLLTMVEVSAADPAFAHPTKPIGAVYTLAQAEAMIAEKGWTMARDGDSYRRVVPSPKPVRLLEMQAVRWLLEKGAVVICAGGGGIPVVKVQDGRYCGAEAVVDKDASAALLAAAIDADLLVIATDVPGVFRDWGTPSARLVRRMSPDALGAQAFAAGSMAPKVKAACEFAKHSGRRAVIGALGQIDALIAGTAGTSVDCAYAESVEEEVKGQG